MTFREQGAEGKRFRSCPIDPVAGFNRLAAGIKKPLDGAVYMKALWHRSNFGTNVFEQLKVNARIAAPWVIRCIRNREAGPAAVEPVSFIGLVTLARLQFGVESGPPVALHLLDLTVGDNAFDDQFFGIDFQRGGM